MGVICIAGMALRDPDFNLNCAQLDSAFIRSRPAIELRH